LDRCGAAPLEAVIAAVFSAVTWVSVRSVAPAPSARRWCTATVTPLGVTIAQLRGHLAYLKLTDAAAALPAVLDTAKTEKLSATATLERLLRIEVQATEARRVAGRLRFANLPTAATLDDFDYDAQPGVDPALISNLASNRYLDTATNILLIGPPGVGKTMLAVGLARRAAEPVTARTSPTPPTSRPAATGRRSRAGGRPRCGSTPARRA
jgi:hypothetical protein